MEVLILGIQIFYQNSSEIMTNYFTEPSEKIELVIEIEISFE